MRFMIPMMACLLLASCGGKHEKKDVPTSFANLNNANQSLPSGYNVGEPYSVNGIQYVPQENFHYSEVGKAIVYKISSGTTTSGEVYNPDALTAAHKILPLGSFVQVTDLNTGKSIDLRINDRGPFVDEGLIHITPHVAKKLGIDDNTPIRVDVLEKKTKAFIASGTLAPEGVAVAARPVSIFNPASPKPVGKEQSFYVQAGAFSDKNNAQRLKTTLLPYGSARISWVKVNGREFFRVQVGPYENRGEAEIALTSVQSVNPDARIVADE